MKNSHNLLIIIALLLTAYLVAGCSAIYPALRVTDVSATKDFILYPDVSITIVNEGAEGTVLVIVRQGSKTQKKLFFFSKNEKKEVKISCTTFESGQYSVEAKAAELASREEMENASS